MLVYGPRTDVRAGRCVRPSVSMSSLPDAPAAAALQEDFGRGQHHLSTLLEEGNVVAYQVGTWLVDNVEVGPGTPPRCLFCRVDYLQLNWSHNCEHGVIGGTRLLLDGGGDPSCVMALDESKEVSFGPEQLLARLPAEWSADAGTATLRCPMPGSLQHLLLSPPPPPPSPPSSPLSRQSRPPTMDACYSTAAGRPPRHEMALEVRPTTDGRGLGAFATRPAAAGEYVTSYRGALLTRDQAAEASRRHGSSYLFALGDVYLDATESCHASRFLNHAESGSLVAAPAVGGRGVDFFAARDLAEGTELSFDYGVGYWAGREDDPAPGTDSRLAAIRVRRAVGGVAPFLQAARWCLPL
mmetsp:Transcript_35215/g.112561  ORF Transcript_35215/g.112561 Transcript_35215/m.112561 type:complete len:354 (-) Transcript_35215:35-1096(-)